MSGLTILERQRFKAKEWSYSVYGNIVYNEKQLACKRCNSSRVAKFVYGDEFMRLCSKDKLKCEHEIIRLKHLCLSINVSPTRAEGSKDYFCLNCGYEW